MFIVIQNDNVVIYKQQPHKYFDLEVLCILCQQAVNSLLKVVETG